MIGHPRQSTAVTAEDVPPSLLAKCNYPLISSATVIPPIMPDECSTKLLHLCLVYSPCKSKEEVKLQNLGRRVGKAKPDLS